MILASLGFFIPALVNFVLQFFLVSFVPLVLLDATQWIATITLITGVYTSGNIVQDKIFKEEPKSISKEDLDELFEDEGD